MSDQKRIPRVTPDRAADAERSLGLLLNTFNEEPHPDVAWKDLEDLLRDAPSNELVPAIERWEAYFLYSPPEGGHNGDEQESTWAAREFLNTLRTYQRACLVHSVRSHINPQTN